MKRVIAVAVGAFAIASGASLLWGQAAPSDPHQAASLPTGEPASEEPISGSAIETAAPSTTPHAQAFDEASTRL